MVVLAGLEKQRKQKLERFTTNLNESIKQANQSEQKNLNTLQRELKILELEDQFERHHKNFTNADSVSSLPLHDPESQLASEIQLNLGSRIHIREENSTSSISPYASREMLNTVVAS